LSQAKIKAYELRSNNKGALVKKLDELKNELGQVPTPSNCAFAPAPCLASLCASPSAMRGAAC